MTTPQPTKEEQFKYRFAAVLKDLQAAGARDGEAMAMIGTLSANIVRSMGQNSWSGAKSVMSSANYDELLASFQRQGNALHKEGKQKQAYAVQVLACSLVAATQRKDPTMAEGEKLIDAAIDHATSAALRLAGTPVGSKADSEAAPKRKN